MTETIRTDIHVVQHEGTWYTDGTSLEKLLEEWAAGDPRRAVGGDDDLVLTYWDETEQVQKIDVRFNDVDVAHEIGLGWSLLSLPFTIEISRAIEDLDDTDHAATWIQVGHVLDFHEVEYIRGLFLPEPLVLNSEG